MNSMPPSAVRSLIASLLTLIAVTVRAQSADTWGVYTHIKAEAQSNGMPVLSLDGDWSRGYDRHDGPQRAYAYARAEWGVMGSSALWSGFVSPWRFGGLTRVDASAVLSGEAAEVLYRYQSRTDPPAGSRYNADASMLYWKGQGTVVHAPTVRVGGLLFDMNWDHLRLSRLRSSQTEGEASYNVDGRYGYQMQVRDDSWKTTEPFMRPPDSAGIGDAFSVAMSWQQDGQTTSAPWLPSRVSLNVDDVWSLLRWQGINGNDAVLNSNVATHTPDGYVEYQAAIQGQYTRRTLRERIPVGTQLQMVWAAPMGDWGLRVQNRLGLWQRWLSWQSDGSVRYLLAGEPLHHALQLGVSWRSLSASLVADRVDNSAHLQGAELSWALGF